MKQITKKQQHILVLVSLTFSLLQFTLIKPNTKCQEKRLEVIFKKCFYSLYWVESSTKYTALMTK